MGSLVEPLGLTLHEVTHDLALQLGFAETTRGLLVLRVDPQSSLVGNVDVYDVLEEIGRTPVATVADAQNALAHKEAGGEVLLRFTRRSGGVSAATSSFGSANSSSRAPRDRGEVPEAVLPEVGNAVFWLL